MIDKIAIERAKDHFANLLEIQMQRMERIKAAPDWIDYSKISPIKIGIIAGDGIGPYIAGDAKRILTFLLKDEVASGQVVIKDIQGLTIENRSAHKKAIPDDVLAEIKKYHITLKGPTTTPRKGDPWPNIESCNVACEKSSTSSPTSGPSAFPSRGSTGSSSERTPKTCTPWAPTASKSTRISRLISASSAPRAPTGSAGSRSNTRKRTDGKK